MPPLNWQKLFSDNRLFSRGFRPPKRAGKPWAGNNRSWTGNNFWHNINLIFYQLNLGLRFFFFLGFSGCCSSIGLTSAADGSMDNKEDKPLSSVCVLVGIFENVFTFLFICGVIHNRIINEVPVVWLSTDYRKHNAKQKY